MPMPFFPFYVRDWLSSSSVAALTRAEKGAYIDLLARMWEHSEGRDGCYLPADDVYLARLLQASPREWKSLRAVLIDGPGAVFHIDGNRLTNPRLTKEWANAQEISRSRSKAGKASAAARASNTEATRVEHMSDECAASHIPHAQAQSQEAGEREDADASLSAGVAEAAAAADPGPVVVEPVDSVPEARDVVQAWNEAVGSALPNVRDLSPERRKKLRTRLHGRPGRDLSWWRAYFARIRASPFCCGENDRGWRADFGWAIGSEENVTKVLEGKYDERGPTPQQQSNVVGIMSALQAAGRLPRTQSLEVVADDAR